MLFVSSLALTFYSYLFIMVLPVLPFEPRTVYAALALMFAVIVAVVLSISAVASFYFDYAIGIGEMSFAVFGVTAIVSILVGMFREYFSIVPFILLVDEE